MKDPVSLNVLSCNVAGLSEDSTDIFLSQISMLTDWDVLTLQECFRKLVVNVGAHDVFTPPELLGGLRCPAVIVNQKWSGQSEIASIWNGSCMKARLGTVSSNKVRMSRRLPLGSAGVSSHLNNDHGIGVAGPDKELDNTKTGLEAAICYADDVVLVAVSMSAAEIIVTEVISNLKEVGLSVGAQKTHWTSYPKMMDRSIMVDGLAVLWEEVLEFVGSKVCLDGNA